jgi:hypothetical protein
MYMSYLEIHLYKFMSYVTFFLSYRTVLQNTSKISNLLSNFKVKLQSLKIMRLSAYVANVAVWRDQVQRLLDKHANTVE